MKKHKNMNMARFAITLTVVCATILLADLAHANNVLNQTNSSNVIGTTTNLTDPASSVDLLQGLTPTYSAVPNFDKKVSGSTGLTDGVATTTNTATENGTYFPVTFGTKGHLPFTVTFILDTNSAPAGYDLNKFNSFAGWEKNGATLGNQRFEFLVRQAGFASYVSLGTYAYTPFAAADGAGPCSTLISLTGTNGVFATGIDSVQFVFTDTGVAAFGVVDGFVIKELDLFGSATTVKQPRIVNFSLSGTNLIFASTNGVAGGPYMLLASANVSLPLSEWTPMLTNNFDGSGNFNFTNGTTPDVGQQFYILSR